MDYALVQALQHCTNCAEACVFYDIMCSFFKHFRERCEDSDFLEIPENLEILRAIGLFHVHGHKKECLPRFASTFIPGAGQVDGEIIETLWVPLNEISGSTRYMSKAYRQETLDLHMNDVNWKKLTRTGQSTFFDFGLIPARLYIELLVLHSFTVPSLLRKWKAVKKGVQDSEEAYKAICSVISKEDKIEWRMQEEKAQEERWNDETAMDIYLVDDDAGICSFFLGNACTSLN